MQLFPANGRTHEERGIPDWLSLVRLRLLEHLVRESVGQNARELAEKSSRLASPQFEFGGKFKKGFFPENPDIGLPAAVKLKEQLSTTFSSSNHVL